MCCMLSIFPSLRENLKSSECGKCSPKVGSAFQHWAVCHSPWAPLGGVALGHLGPASCVLAHRESNRASRLVFRSMENQGEHLAPNETRAPGISRKPGVPAHAFTVLENKATLHGLNCDTTSSTDRSAVDKGQKDLSPLPED